MTITYPQASRTAASRRKTADRIFFALRDIADIVTIGAETDGTRQLSIYAELGGMAVDIELDGGSRLQQFLTHWHGRTTYEGKLPALFAHAIGGDVNPFHRRKATGCYETLEEMIERTVAGFKCLARAEVLA